MDQTRRTVALHEAGHAVAFVRLFPTRSVHRVTIVPGPEYEGKLWHDPLVSLDFVSDNEIEMATEDGYLGTDGHLHDWDEISQIDRKREAIMTASGFAALVAAGHTERDAAHGCDFDFRAVRNAGFELLDIQEAALELMSRPENVVAVAKLAAALLERATIPGDEILTVIQAADEGD